MKDCITNPLTTLAIDVYNSQLHLLEIAKKSEIVVIPVWVTLHQLSDKDSPQLDYPIVTAKGQYITLHIGQKKYNLVPTWQMFSCAEKQALEVICVNSEIANHLIEFAEELKLPVQFVSMIILDDHRLDDQLVPGFLGCLRKDCLLYSTYNA